MNYDKKLNLRITENDYKKLEKVSKSLGIKIPDYIRKRALLRIIIDDLYLKLKNTRKINDEIKKEITDISLELKEVGIVWANTLGLYETLKNEELNKLKNIGDLYGNK